MERSTKMAIGGMVLIVIVLVVGYQMILDQAFKNACGNEILAESLSPDGSKKFVVFQRSCGATTGFSTQAQHHMAARVFKVEQRFRDARSNMKHLDEAAG
jgi:hypothetical protein